MNDCDAIARALAPVIHLARGSSNFSITRVSIIVANPRIRENAARIINKRGSGTRQRARSET